MGAWGPGIFSNDTAADARDAWRAALVEGQDPTAATEKLIRQLGGGFDDTDFWTGLAAAQHETGHLQDEVRERALAVIADGADLELWDESGERAARERALRRLEDKLRGPQPAPKRLRGPRPGPDPGVNTGDVLRIWSPDRSRSALFCVAAIEEVQRSRWPALVGLFDEDGTEPDLEELRDWEPAGRPLVVIVSVSRRGEEFGPEIGEVVAHDLTLAFEPDLSDENEMTDNPVTFAFLAEAIGRGEHDVRGPVVRPPGFEEGTVVMRRFWIENLRRTLEEASAVEGDELTEREAQLLAELRAAAEAMFADQEDEA